MKKRNLFIVALFLISFATVNAQIFKKGDLVGNLTIGIGNALYSGGLTGATSSIPPISVSVEYGILDNVADKGSIGLGGIVGYTSSTWDYSDVGYTWKEKASDFVIGARGSFHYPFVDKLDTYAGLALVADVRSWSESGTAFSGYSANASQTYIRLPGFVGARYYFTDKFAVLGEIGWGIAYLNLGIALKIK